MNDIAIALKFVQEDQVCRFQTVVCARNQPGKTGVSVNMTPF